MHIKFKILHLKSQINFILLRKIKRIIHLYKTTYIINFKGFITIIWIQRWAKCQKFHCPFTKTIIELLQLKVYSSIKYIKMIIMFHCNVILLITTLTFNITGTQVWDVNFKFREETTFSSNLSQSSSLLD